MSRRLAVVAAVLVLAAVATLAVVVTREAVDRRGRAPCPGASPAPVVETVEERTWWPLGQRCTTRHADGATGTSSTSWALTALVGLVAAIVATGALAPPGSVRRSLGLVVAVPILPLAALVAAAAQPPRATQLVGLVTISLGLTALPGALTGLGAWYVLRGRPLVTWLVSWLLWAAAVFWQSKDAVQL